MTAEKNPHGAELLPEGGVRFRLWAPACDHVAIEIGGEEPLAMNAAGDGWWELVSPGEGAGTRYRFVLPDGLRVPDPASRFQPEDVHGPCEVIDPDAFAWGDFSWRGRPWEEAVLYELHVGTFTPEGTFRAAAGKLDYLRDLGVTAISLMPVADFPGTRNWGYDGVLLYAPDSSYGRPEDLKALVDAAHARGLMVLQDVVYNHFGPDGNYLSLYAPGFRTHRHRTPWGDALNFDGEASRPVRDFVIHNALYWLREFHMDGLRLDAVHAILDDGPVHVLRELAEAVRAAAGDRHFHLVLENEENQAMLLGRDSQQRPLLYTAQWNDDMHHVLHTAATGESSGYYTEYQGDTRKLGRALAEGFAFQGEDMPYRGHPRGENCSHLPPTAFVAFLQNHDQIGNRAFGDRIGAIVPLHMLRAVASVYLLLPQIPLLFMGEEWNASAPFPFFCDFHDELAEAVRKGRRAEFAPFPEFQDCARREQIPDPNAEKTFASGKLAWNERDAPEHARHLSWYRAILAKRREAIVPLLPDIHHGGAFDVRGEEAVEVSWQLADSRRLLLSANLSGTEARGFSGAPGHIIWEEGAAPNAAKTLPAWSVRWMTIE